MNTTLSRIFPNWQTKVLLFLYTASAVWWLTIAARGIVNTTENYLFNLPLAIIPIIGAIFALVSLSAVKDSLRFGIIALSFGLIFWGSGNLIYLYYNLVPTIAVPIWSLADIGYISSQICFFIGVIFIARHYNQFNQIKRVVAKMLFFVIPIAVASSAFVLLILDATRISIPLSPALFNHLTTIPDFIIFSVLLIMLYGALFQHIPIPKVPIIVFTLGYVVHYLADLTYARAVAADTFFVASYIDFIFLTGIFLFTIAVNLFCSRAIFKH